MMVVKPLIIKTLPSETLVIPTSNSILHSKYTLTAGTMLIGGSIPTGLLHLADLELNKMAAILQTTISNTSSCVRIEAISTDFFNYVANHFPNQ